VLTDIAQKLKVHMIDGDEMLRVVIKSLGKKEKTLGSISIPLNLTLNLPMNK
jgi:hypothetical protein